MMPDSKTNDGPDGAVTQTAEGPAVEVFPVSPQPSGPGRRSRFSMPSANVVGIVANVLGALAVTFVASSRPLALAGALPVVLSGMTLVVTAFSLYLLSRDFGDERDAVVRRAMLYAGVGIVTAGAIATLLVSFPGDEVLAAFLYVPSWLLASTLLLANAGIFSSVGHRRRLPERAKATSITIPPQVTRVERGALKAVPLELVKEGNVLLVTDGQVVPVDGVILEGSGTVDERALTGTGATAQRLPGSRLYAGSTVVHGRFLITVHARGEKTLLSRLHERPPDALDASLHKRARMGVNVIGVGGIIAGVVVGANMAFASSMFSGLVTFASVVAVTGSGAVIASTLTRHSAADAVALTGARVRTSDALVKLVHTHTVVLEKTGVLTSGSVSVANVVSFKPYTQQQVLNLAAAVETHSDSRAGKAVVGFSRTMGAISLQRADDVKEEEGAGIRGVVGGKEVMVGSPAYVRRKKVRIPKDAFGPADEGNNVLVVALEKEAIGFIALADATRDETAAAVKAIRHGRSVVMLTSDLKAAAAVNARNAGIDIVISDVLPSMKGAEIAKLRSTGKKVALVALVARPEADVSVVLFDGHNEEAVAGADIVLRHDDLSAVAELFAALDATSEGFARDSRRARMLVGAGVVLAVVVPYLAWIVPLVRSRDGVEKGSSGNGRSRS